MKEFWWQSSLVRDATNVSVAMRKTPSSSATAETPLDSSGSALLQAGQIPVRTGIDRMSSVST
jgi:hypothetical protein